MTTTTEPHVCGLTPTQERLLLDAIKPERVSSRDGMSYVEAWDDRRHLDRIFGFMGWAEECLECTVLDDNAHPRIEKHGAKKGQPIEGSICYTVVYRYRVRVQFKCRCGKALTFHDGAAAGDGINLPTRCAAHDFALKTAASQAVKRACINLGDQFGLSLYNNGSTNAVVIGTAFTMDENAMKAAEAKVIGGEMDDQPDPSADQFVGTVQPDDGQTVVPQAAFDALKEPGGPGNYKDRPRTSGELSALRAEIARRGRKLGFSVNELAKSFESDCDTPIGKGSVEQLQAFLDGLPEPEDAS